MAHEELCCGLYRGKFYLQDLSDPNAPLLPVGNAEATISQTLTEITQPNFQSLGGSACKVEFVESVSLDLVLHCTNPKNMALAFLGTAAQINDDSVTDEEHTVRGVSELIAFKQVPDRSQAIVVTDEAGITTYEAGKDYQVTAAGIVIIEGTTIPMNSVIKISYAHGANYVLDAQTVGQKEFRVVLDGFNAGAAGDRAVVLKAHKVKFAPTDSFALISGTEFASLNLSGEILRDESVVSGSKFFKVEWGIAAEQVY